MWSWSWHQACKLVVVTSARCLYFAARMSVVDAGLWSVHHFLRCWLSVCHEIRCGNLKSWRRSIYECSSMFLRFWWSQRPSLLVQRLTLIVFLGVQVQVFVIYALLGRFVDVVVLQQAHFLLWGQVCFQWDYSLYDGDGMVFLALKGWVSLFVKQISPLGAICILWSRLLQSADRQLLLFLPSFRETTVITRFGHDVADVDTKAFHSLHQAFRLHHALLPKMTLLGDAGLRGFMLCYRNTHRLHTSWLHRFKRHRCFKMITRRHLLGHLRSSSLLSLWIIRLKI